MPRGIPADLVGQRFGFWTVLARDHVTEKNQVKWLCRCVCGNESLVSTGNLTRGRSRRCRPCSMKRENNPRWAAFRSSPAPQSDMSASDQKGS